MLSYNGMASFADVLGEMEAIHAYAIVEQRKLYEGQ